MTGRHIHQLDRAQHTCQIHIEQTLHSRLDGDLLLHGRHKAGQSYPHRIKIGRKQAESENAPLVGDGSQDEALGPIEEKDGSAHLGDSGRIPDEASDTARKLGGFGGEGCRRRQHQRYYPAIREF